MDNLVELANTIASKQDLIRVIKLLVQELQILKDQIAKNKESDWF